MAFHKSIVLGCLMLLVLTDSTNNKDDEVKSVQFVALYKQYQTLHFVDDYFRLIQTITFKPMVENIYGITSKVKNMSLECRLDQNITEAYPIEKRLNLVLENILYNIQGGLQMLPQDPRCSGIREQRSIEMEDGPVDTWSAFPIIGWLNHKVTGVLDSEAGEIINMNYKNIEILSQTSVRFAKMINASLQIEKKQRKHIEYVQDQVLQLKMEFKKNIRTTEREILYLRFLENVVVVVEDMYEHVDTIFDHTDKAEQNLMGPLARDPSFLKTVNTLMNADGINAKDSILYLMKIGSKTEVMACNHMVTITYRFPILKKADYTPWRAMSVPKKIKGKYFELSKLPYIVMWGEQVYTMTQSEYDQCDIHNRHIFCQTPYEPEQFSKSCIYGLLTDVAWTDLAKICPLTYVEDPGSFIEVTQSHIIYGNLEKQLVSILCPKAHALGETTSVQLKGSGIITVPNGCKVTMDGKKSFTMGHIERSVEVQFHLDDRIWNLDMEKFLPILQVDNVENVSTLWNTDDEEQFIEQELKETTDLLSNMHFTKTGTTITFMVLIGLIGVMLILLCLVLYYICCNRAIGVRPNVIAMNALPAFNPGV